MADREIIHRILTRWNGMDSLKELFWRQCNYSRANDLLPRREWPQTVHNALADDPLLFATGGDNADFHLLYCRLAKPSLSLSDERAVINCLLRDRPYALFVFSDSNQENWHVVNVKDGAVKDEEGKKRRLLRRIAIGERQGGRTASERLALLDLSALSPSLFGLSPLEIQQRHDEAFNVEAVTSAFFERYKEICTRLQNHLMSISQDKTWAHDYALQLLNRIMFLYFIQRKRCLGDDPEFITSFWEAYQDSSQPRDTFFEQWLSVLFFEAFNNKFQAGRHDRQHLPADIRNALADAPWLNGGLFRENDLDQRYPVAIPDAQFRAIFEFLNAYNFTIAESTPFDIEVAVDPEMIGKVYETLVNITFEGDPEEDQRGSAGIFYTPRVEIDLMCRLSLVDCLASHLGAGHKTLLYQALFAYDPDEKREADEVLTNANLWGDLNRLLREITVCDPACGSGSFLVGMLMVLDDFQARANDVLGEEETPYERRKRIIGQSLYGVDVMGWAVHVAELRLWLQLVIETDLHAAEFRFRPLLPSLSFKVRPGDSLVQEVGGIHFGLHRQHVAIPSALKGRIARLKGEKLKFTNNERSAQSEEWIRHEESRLFHEILQHKQKALTEEIKQLTRDIESGPPQMNLPGWEGEPSKEHKVKVAEWEKERASQQAELHHVDQALEALKPSEPVPFVWDIAFVEIFEGDKQGFDIVIGNPPYVRQEKIAPPLLRPEDYRGEESAAWKNHKTEYKAKLMRSAVEAYSGFFAGRQPSAKSDLYIYFYVHGLSLLNSKGSFCFITSNSWLDVGYGKDLQEFLLKHGQVKFILDCSRRSFEQADVNTIIALLASADDRREDGLQKTARFVMFRVPYEEIMSAVIFDELESATERMSRPEYRVCVLEQAQLYREGLTGEEEEEQPGRGRQAFVRTASYVGNKWGGKYLRAPDIYFKILEKGKDKLVRLGDIAEVRRGFTTGANDFFYVRVLDVQNGIAQIRCDDGSEHNLPADMLYPAIVRPGNVIRPRVTLDMADYMLVCIPQTPKNEFSSLIQAYIEWGERQDFHRRSTLRNRRFWYSLTPREPGWILTPMARKRRSLVGWNEGRLQVDHNLFEVLPKSEDALLIIGVSLIATFTVLQAELLGRANLGQGALKTEGVDIAIFSVLNPINIDQSVRKDLQNAFTALIDRNILMLYDEVRRKDRKDLDDAFLEAIGFQDPQERKSLVEELQEAACRMIWHRLAKSDNAREARLTYDEWKATGQPFGMDVEEEEE